MELGPHFFRHESARLVATLVRVFGVHNLPLAEDVAQDAIFAAMQVWPREGVPASPSAWLTAVAKRRANDALRRERTRRLATPELTRLLESEWTRVPLLDELLESPPLRDDELRLMFSLTQPRLPEMTRLGLVLSLLCGFGDEEVAAAFLVAPSAMAKRLQRARRIVSGSRSLSELSERDVAARADSVRRALYLLFNEGYHGASEATVRGELCGEAIRLAGLLVAHPVTSSPASLALLALMKLNAARLPGRVDHEGALVRLEQQDRSLWDRSLIAEGLALLERSASGDALSSYHVEAAISACHAMAESAGSTPWPHVVELYDILLQLRPDPIVALNRAIAVARAVGPREGLAELARVADREELRRYPFYAGAMAELSS